MNEVMELKSQELDEVNGGGWGYHKYHNEDEYKAAGIQTDWTYNPFKKDVFKFNGEKIESDTAAKIVFFHRKNPNLPTSAITISDALNYAADNHDAFEADMKAANR